MKKVVGFILATVLLATTVVAYAAPNVVGPDNTGDIPVEIRLGFDPTIGPGPAPAPDYWIAVQIPTAILIMTNPSATPAHSEFIVANHTIRNFSIRGVRVDVDSFTNVSALSNFAAIDLLTINSGTNSHDLITNGTFLGTAPVNSVLMTLPASASGATYYTSDTFNFTGDVDASALTTVINADTELTLRLRPIQADGITLY